MSQIAMKVRLGWPLPCWLGYGAWSVCCGNWMTFTVRPVASGPSTCSCLSVVKTANSSHVKRPAPSRNWAFTSINLSLVAMVKQNKEGQPQV
eukprot:CAMPEP_0172765472 /NCGR_PEP_ID=MMETSP1074-20121228/179340_1 /TAXON_ID=2916 /ORGANISM="Ceratium fusus, Strain PA161109" /LENGTH=91 /DNA_ID=CAMNT_0013600421 /DNA_START=324 /DNA_END=599 /DNA_ORIENTATION=-